LSGLSRRRLWLLALVAFVIGAVAFLPAHQFEPAFNHALPAPWNIVLTGTPWKGSGVLRSGPAPEALSVPLAWKFEPLALARLRAAWTVIPDSPGLSGTLRVGVGWHALEFSQAALALDAEYLPQAIPLLALLAPSGSVRLSTPGNASLTLETAGDMRLIGEALLEADNLALRPAGPAPLGNYQLKFSAHGSVVDYTVTRSSGALTLDGGGKIQLSPVREISYSGQATPSPALPEAVQTLLNAAGQTGADGRLQLDWKGRW
jgi:hypothetical protein